MRTTTNDEEALARGAASVMEHRQEILYYARGFLQAAEDFTAIRNGKEVLYLLDFNLLYPQCFDTYPSGTKSPLLSTVDPMRRILAKARSVPGMELAVTGATVLEFEDMLAHTVADINAKIPELPTLEELRREDVLADAWNPGERLTRLQKDLRLLTESGRTERVRQPIKKFLSLLDNGSIHQAGDLIDMGGILGKQNRDAYRKFVEQQSKERLPTDDRDYDDAMFHYRVDAANITITWAAKVDSHKRVLFVSPGPPINYRQCVDGQDALGRSELTPLILVNAQDQRRSNVIGEIRAFFARIGREGMELVREIPKGAKDAELPSDVLHRIMHYYGTIGLVVYGSEAERKKKTFSSIDREQILESLGSPTIRAQKQEELVEEIRAGAREIEARLPHGEIAYLEEFDFANDPAFRRFRRVLGLDAI